MITEYLLLWLEAPLQSWGHDSKFGRRDTLDFPTKSGIMGLLCCALGKTGEQSEFLAEFASLKQTVISFARIKSNSQNENQEKVFSEPLLRDFHMVGSGYDDKDPWQSLLIPKTQSGKKAVGGGAKLTYRYYLQDRYFAVILEVPKNKSAILAQALQQPVWDLYLGRKSCAPTDFIYRGTFDSEEIGIENAQQIASDKLLIEDFKVLDKEVVGGELITLNDVPLCFGTDKKYRDRHVTLIHS